MDQFFSPAWWISVVVVGLLVNLASAYLKPRLDSALLRSSSWWRERSTARISKRQRYIDELLQHDKRVEAYLQAIVMVVFAIYMFLLAVFIGALAVGARLLAPAYMPKDVALGGVVVGVFLGVVAVALFDSGFKTGMAIAESKLMQRLHPSSSAPPT